MTSKFAPEHTGPLNHGHHMAPPNHTNATQRGQHNPQRSTHRTFHRKAVELTGGDPKIAIRSQNEVTLSHSRRGKVNHETSGLREWHSFVQLLKIGRGPT